MFLPSAIDVKHCHFVSFVNKYISIFFLFAMFTFQASFTFLKGLYYKLMLYSIACVCPVSLCFVDLFFLNELRYIVDPVKRLYDGLILSVFIILQSLFVFGFLNCNIYHLKLRSLVLRYKMNSQSYNSLSYGSLSIEGRQTKHVWTYLFLLWRLYGHLWTMVEDINNVLSHHCICYFDRLY
jgi:hypothetical protein